MNKQAERAGPDDRIEMIQNSLRCFHYGLASVAPMVILPVAVVMIFQHDTVRQAGCALGGLMVAASLPLSMTAGKYYRKARLASKGHWNPARNFRLGGEIMSSAGVLLSLVTLVLIVCVWAELIP